MILSLDKDELQNYLIWQIDYRFPDRKSHFDFHDHMIAKAFDEGLERTENCFNHISIRGYEKDGECYFNHLHMDQYSQFLYFFSNSLWKLTDNQELCSKLILLNRDMSGCWFSYKADFPDIFALVHPVGTVIGHVNVEFSDYLMILQNVTINSLPDTTLKLGKGLLLAAGAKIIGGGYIGDRVSIGAGTTVKNPNVPDDYIVYRDDVTGAIVQKPNNKTNCFVQDYFKDMLRE